MDPVAGPYEHGNEPTISLNTRVAEPLLASQEGLRHLMRQ
jgi:hypothetical protein